MAMLDTVVPLVRLLYFAAVAVAEWLVFVLVFEMVKMLKRQKWMEEIKYIRWISPFSLYRCTKLRGFFIQLLVGCAQFFGKLHSTGIVCCALRTSPGTTKEITFILYFLCFDLFHFACAISIQNFLWTTSLCERAFCSCVVCFHLPVMSFAAQIHINYVIIIMMNTNFRKPTTISIPVSHYMIW